MYLGKYRISLLNLLKYNKLTEKNINVHGIDELDIHDI